MSITIFCGPKYSWILQLDEGYAAEGLPQVEISIEESEAACVIEAGTLGRYVTPVPSASRLTIGSTVDLHSRTTC